MYLNEDAPIFVDLQYQKWGVEVSLRAFGLIAVSDHGASSAEAGEIDASRLVPCQDWDGMMAMVVGHWYPWLKIPSHWSYGHGS